MLFKKLALAWHVGTGSVHRRTGQGPWAVHRAWGPACDIFHT